MRAPGEKLGWIDGRGTELAGDVPSQAIPNLGDWTIGDVSQGVSEPGIWINAIKFGSLSELIDRGGVFTTAVGADEQIIPAFNGDSTQGTFRGRIIHLYSVVAAAEL